MNIPTVITAETRGGGHIKIHTIDPNKTGETNIGGSARNLNQAEYDAYKRAKKALGNGNAEEAVTILKAADFIF